MNIETIDYRKTVEICKMFGQNKIVINKFKTFILQTVPHSGKYFKDANATNVGVSVIY